MVSLSSTLRVAIDGINTSQLGLGTVAHNIANTNTEGYHKQTVQLAAVSYDGFGSGTKLQAIARSVDSFLTKRVTDQTSAFAYADTTYTQMQDIQTLLGDPTGDSGLDKLLNNMFTQMANLSNQTDSLAQRRNMVQQAVLVADSFNDLSADLSTAQQRIDDYVDAGIDTVNLALSSINSLNVRIVQQGISGTNGANANDLTDERQRQIDVVAAHLSIQVTETENGAMRIVTDNGRMLVDTATYSQLERGAGTPYQTLEVRKVLADGTGAPNALLIDTDTLSSGKIKALVDMRDDTIPDLLAQINELASEFMGEVNRLHSQGSSFPPVRTLTSGNTANVAATTTDLLTNGFSSLSGNQIHISVVDSTGDPVYTTRVTGLSVTGTGPITITPILPATTLSLADMATIINTSTIGVTTLGAGLGITASAALDANGAPYLQVQSTNSNLRVVLSNASGDALGTLGMNNFFTGTNSTDIAVKSTIVADPSLVATARMRTTDGGLSSLDNSNILELAKLSNTANSFDAAGGLSAQSDTFVGYMVDILSSFAVDMQDSSDRNDFNTAMMESLDQQNAAVSGVNVDEELSQMLIYQNAYQASARLIRTIDDLLQFLIQSLG
ncbi:MAG: flagellar hook-associated protein FlgK [Alphaproteobacteria bacterium]